MLSYFIFFIQQDKVLKDIIKYFKFNFFQNLINSRVETRTTLSAMAAADAVQHRNQFWLSK